MVRFRVRVGQAQSMQTGRVSGPLARSAAVLDQKARRAGELVGLLGHDRHGQVLAGQIGTGQLHTFPGVGLVEIHDRGLLVGPGRGQGVQ